MKPTNQCTAKANSTGQRCRRAPVAGATVCRVHGGAARQVKAAAARRVKLEAARADAAATLAHIGLVPVDDPILELGKIAAEVLAMKDALAQRVNALNSLTETTPLGAVQVKAEVDLYNTAIDKSVRVLDALGKHDLGERQVRINEQVAGQFEQVLDKLLASLDLTPSQQDAAVRALPGILREVTG